MSLRENLKKKARALGKFEPERKGERKVRGGENDGVLLLTSLVMYFPWTNSTLGPLYQGRSREREKRNRLEEIGRRGKWIGNLLVLGFTIRNKCQKIAENDVEQKATIDHNRKIRKVRSMAPKLFVKIRVGKEIRSEEEKNKQG